MRIIGQQFCCALASPAIAWMTPGPETTGNAIFNGLWTYLGVPCVNLPLFSANGLPLGVQLVGKRGDEARLLRTAKWLDGHKSARA